MPDESRDSLALLSLWQRYDAASEGDKADMRKLIELHITAATYRQHIANIERFQREFLAGQLKPKPR